MKIALLGYGKEGKSAEKHFKSKFNAEIDIFEDFTYDEIKDYFECEYRGKIPAKHKGEIDMYFVNRLKPESSADEEGFIPNSAFRTMLAQL